MKQEPTGNEASQQNVNQAKGNSKSPTRKLGLAKWSLALGIASIPLLGQESAVRLLTIPVSLCAVIFGHMAIHKIGKSSGQFGGRGLAMAGLIIGYLICVAILMEPLLYYLRSYARSVM